MSILAAAGVVADTTGTVFNQVATSIQALIGAVPHGVQMFNSAGSFNFTVPAGVTTIEVAIWAGGSGSWASTASIAGGGGSGGGYARKRITGLTPGAVIPLVVGGGGAGTTAPVAPTAGGASSFGSGPYLSATGGVVNPTNSTGNPMSGNLAGVGSGGDVNFYGDDGAQAIGSQGGMGGGAGAGSGGPNSGTSGRMGYAPGGGASGAANPSATAYNGAAGAAGACVVRW